MSEKCKCGAVAKDQHTLSQAGKCDAISKGKLGDWRVNVGKKI